MVLSLDNEASNFMIKKGRLKTLIKIIVICGVVFVTLILTVFIYNREFHRWLPTQSKANELRVAAYAGSIRELSVVLKYADASEHVLNIVNGVENGEPQKYPLPDLKDGSVIVHATIYGYNLAGDMDVMVFSNANELKRSGLLIYFMDLYRMYVISGEKTVCYGYDTIEGYWFIVEDPPPLFRDPAGVAPNDWTSDWQNNEWAYIESEQDKQ